MSAKRACELMKMCRDAPMTIRGVLAEVDWDEDTARRNLNELVRHGILDRGASERMPGAMGHPEYTYVVSNAWKGARKEDIVVRHEEGFEMKNTKEALTNSELGIRVIDLLDKNPAGMHLDSVVAELCEPARKVSRLMSKFKGKGLIMGVFEGTQNATRRMRHYLPKHESEAMAASRAAKGNEFGKGRVRAPVLKSPEPHAWKSKPVTSRKNGKGSIKTVAKTPPSRYHVDKPEAFFSAMTPGSYLRTGSAIERAYGGGK